MIKDVEQAIRDIWETLHKYRDYIPEGIDANDREWESICENMATIQEELDLGDMFLEGES